MGTTLLTPGQKLTLFFDLKMNIPVTKKIELFLTFCTEFGSKKVKRTFNKGRFFSAVNRTATVMIEVPKDILGGKKRKIIPKLGTYFINIDGKKILTEDLSPVIIIDNYTYFEKETVPNILERLGFTVTCIGGRNEPDIIANHKESNGQLIDVEPTITKEFKLTDLSDDQAKFNRYSRTYNFKRLLSVCESQQISGDVIDELNKTRDPISLIEFCHLYNLLSHVKKGMTTLSAYNCLNRTGKIHVSNTNDKPILFNEIKFLIKRQI